MWVITVHDINYWIMIMVCRFNPSTNSWPDVITFAQIFDSYTGYHEPCNFHLCFLAADDWQPEVGCYYHELHSVIYVTQSDWKIPIINNLLTMGSRCTIGFEVAPLQFYIYYQLYSCGWVSLCTRSSMLRGEGRGSSKTRGSGFKTKPKMGLIVRLGPREGLHQLAVHTQTTYLHNTFSHSLFMLTYSACFVPLSF